jgi:hypothetical protein
LASSVFIDIWVLDVIILACVKSCKKAAFFGARGMKSFKFETRNIRRT